MIEDVLGEKGQSPPVGSVGGSLTRAIRKPSSSLGSTPHEELERLAGTAASDSALDIDLRAFLDMVHFIFISQGPLAFMGFLDTEKYPSICVLLILLKMCFCALLRTN